MLLASRHAAEPAQSPDCSVLKILCAGAITEYVQGPVTRVSY